MNLESIKKAETVQDKVQNPNALISLHAKLNGALLRKSSYLSNESNEPEHEAVLAKNDGGFLAEIRDILSA